MQGGIFFTSCHPFILLDGNKSAAAVFAGPQVPLLLLAGYAANNVEIHLKAVSFTTVRTEFGWHS